MALPEFIQGKIQRPIRVVLYGVILAWPQLPLRQEGLGIF